MKAGGKDTNCAQRFGGFATTETFYLLLIITELSRLPSLPFTVGLDNLLFCRCSIRPDDSNSVDFDGDAPQVKSGTLLL
jgi:hypothetical protein